MNKNNLHKQKKILLIGVGKVGSAFYHTFKKSGYNIQIAVDKNVNRLRKITSGDDKIKIDRQIKKEYLIKSDIIIFAVEEKNLQRVIKLCSEFKLDLKEKILFHASGSETSDIFKYLKVNILNTGSCHPLQTFNTISYNNNNILNNIYYGIEGGPAAINYFIKLCSSFKSKYVIIKKDKKILYHSACVMASNFLVSHYNILSKITKELDVNASKCIEIFKPIIYKTFDNIYTQGIEYSLTGPFERGDIKTIESHLKYIREKLPSFLYYYILLGIEAMNLSLAKKSISKKVAKKIEKLFLNHIY